MSENLDWSIIKFLGTIRNARTRGTYEAGLKKFTEYYCSKGNIRNFIEAIKNEHNLSDIKREGIEYNEFNGFLKFLKSQRKKPKTIDSYIGAVRSYAKETQETRIWSGELFPRASTNKRLSNPWTRDKIRKFMLSSKPQKRCMTALLFQGGLSLSDTLKLEYRDIKEDFETNKVPLCINLTGSRFKEPHLTFVGRASVELLRNHLKSRGLIEPEDKIFQTKERTVQGYFARMSKKNFGWEEKRNIYKPDSLRIAFYEFLWNEGCRESYIEYWLGYGLSSKLPDNLRNIFSIENRELLRTTYAKFESALFLDESISQGLTGRDPSKGFLANSAKKLSVDQRENFGQSMGLDYLPNLCNDIMTLLSDCNDICKFKGKERPFNFSDATPKNLATMNKIVSSEHDFSDFIKASWMIFYEGTSYLKRVPEKFKQEDFIVLTIKYIRHWFFHDFGQEAGEEKKIERLSGKYQFLVGKENLHFLDPKDFQKLQLRILQDLKTFLENLNDI
jgi:integrase